MFFSILNVNSINKNYQTLIKLNFSGGLVQVDDDIKESFKTCGGYYKKQIKKLDMILTKFFGHFQNDPDL